MVWIDEKYLEDLSTCGEMTMGRDWLWLKFGILSIQLYVKFVT